MKNLKAENQYIDNKDYQCFCFYEKNAQQPLPSSISSTEIIMTCDEMIIIGWAKDVHDHIAKLTFKKQKDVSPLFHNPNE
jgi:hypothetical protein